MLPPPLALTMMVRPLINISVMRMAECRSISDEFKFDEDDPMNPHFNAVSSNHRETMPLVKITLAVDN